MNSNTQATGKTKDQGNSAPVLEVSSVGSEEDEADDFNMLSKNELTQ